MTPTEAVALAGYTRAHFPSQPIDEYTADALHELLAPYSLADCQAAVLALAMRTHDHAERAKWCSPTDIYAEVRRARADRLEGAVIEPPPNADPDDVPGYLRWLAAERRAVADGRPRPQSPPTSPELRPHRSVIAELGTVRSVDEALAAPISEARRQMRAGRQKAQATRKPEPAPLLAPEDYSREPEPTPEPSEPESAVEPEEATL